MTTQVLHPLAVTYLERLRDAARHLPRARRDELLADIEAHLAEAIPSDAGDADALNVLERLGTPEEIVAAEQPAPAPRADPRGAREWAAIVLLALGGFAFGVGWLLGLILLWSSPRWAIRDKWVGTLVVPGGWAGTLFALVAAAGPCQTNSSGGGSCGSTSMVTRALQGALFVYFVLGPLFTAIYLARRARYRDAEVVR